MLPEDARDLDLALDPECESHFAALEIDLPEGIDFRSAQMARDIAEILPDIERRVVRDTSWAVDFTRLTCKVLDEQEFAHTTIRDGMRQSGYTEEQIEKELNPSDPVARFAIGVIMKIVGRLASAVYSVPSDLPVVYINGGLLYNVNTQGLGKALYHELVHHAQKDEHPSYFTALKELSTRAIADAKTHGKDSPEYRDSSAALHARMSWIEGQASFLSETGGKECFPGAQMHIGALEVVALIAALASGAGRMKLLQYLEGTLAWKKISRCMPDAIDDMFENPELVDVFLKRTDGEPIPVHPVGLPEECKRIQRLAEDLRVLRESPGSLFDFEEFERPTASRRDPWTLASTDEDVLI